MTVVSVENLSKVYRIGSVDVFGLNGVSLDVDDGEYVAIMGPSGSGKSTLLNLLGCLDRPSKGVYLLAGQDVSSLRDHELSRIRGSKIGFVFQSYNLISQLNVVENIEVPMYYQGLTQKDAHKKAVELAETVGLGHRLRHRPTQLSGGQQQRVAIARALANDPVIILADEPTGNLDSKSGQEILEILNQLHRQGRIIIVVTHDARIAQRAQRTIHMIDGRIEKQQLNS